MICKYINKVGLDQQTADCSNWSRKRVLESNHHHWEAHSSTYVTAVSLSSPRRLCCKTARDPLLVWDSGALGWSLILGFVSMGLLCKSNSQFNLSSTELCWCTYSLWWWSYSFLKRDGSIREQIILKEEKGIFLNSPVVSAVICIKWH